MGGRRGHTQGGCADGQMAAVVGEGRGRRCLAGVGCDRVVRSRLATRPAGRQAGAPPGGRPRQVVAGSGPPRSRPSSEHGWGCACRPNRSFRYGADGSRWACSPAPSYCLGWGLNCPFRAIAVRARTHPPLNPNPAPVPTPAVPLPRPLYGNKLPGTHPCCAHAMS